MSVLGPQIETLRRIQSRQIIGTVSTVRGLSILVDDLPLPIGALVRLQRRDHAGDPKDLPRELLKVRPIE